MSLPPRRSNTLKERVLEMVIVMEREGILVVVDVLHLITVWQKPLRLLLLPLR